MATIFRGSPLGACQSRRMSRGLAPVAKPWVDQRRRVYESTLALLPATCQLEQGWAGTPVAARPPGPAARHETLRKPSRGMQRPYLYGRLRTATATPARRSGGTARRIGPDTTMLFA